MFKNDYGKEGLGMAIKFIICVFVTSLVFAEDGNESKNSLAIEKIIAPALADALKGYEVYQDALAKASDKAVKELDRLKLEAMKKGDLPLAVAVDAQIKALKDGALGDRIAMKPKEKDREKDRKDKADLGGATKAEAPAVKLEITKILTSGRWKYTESAPERNPGNPRLDAFLFWEDGTWATEKNSKWLAGTWRHVKGRTIEMTSNAVVKCVFTFEVKDGAAMVWDTVWTGTVIHVADGEAEMASDGDGSAGGKKVAQKTVNKLPIIGKWQRVDANGKESNEKSYKCTWEFSENGTGLTNNFGRVHWKLVGKDEYYVTVDPGQDPKWSIDRFITVVDNGNEFVEAFGWDVAQGTHYRRADDKSIRPNK